MDRILSNILRIIEFSLNGNEEKCLRYAEQIYDGLENPDVSKENFLKMCSGYFHPDKTGWAVQDSEEETNSIKISDNFATQHQLLSIRIISKLYNWFESLTQEEKEQFTEQYPEFVKKTIYTVN